MEEKHFCACFCEDLMKGKYRSIPNPFYTLKMENTLTL